MVQSYISKDDEIGELARVFQGLLDTIRENEEKSSPSHRTGEITMIDESWSLEKTRTIYGIARNDLHFLDITENGNLCIRLFDKEITVEEVVDRIRATNGNIAGNISSFTLRIPQLISYQIRKLKSSFNRVFEELHYEGKLIGIYPVKVNQRSDYLTAVVRSDSEYGLEAGTKAELSLIKSAIKNERYRRIVCNGIKDPDYLRLIQQSIEEGYRVTISIESLHEAELIVDNFIPETTELVLRVKPYLSVEGHWSNSAGRSSKFGLSIHDLFHVVDLLKQRGFDSCVTTILGHVGSQITDMKSFNRFGKFLTSIYTELREKGLVNLKNIDFGGGLAIDYTSDNSPDLVYQYALNLVGGIKEYLKDCMRDYPTPNIMIESGRGITALAALIIVEALEVRSIFPDFLEKFEDDALHQKMNEYLKKINKANTPENLLAIWKDFHSYFGSMTLSGLSVIYEKEMIIGSLEQTCRQRLKQFDLRVVANLEKMKDFWYPEHIVIGNFSVFNSIADYVLVNQYFPIIPTINLHVQPETTVRLVDITCDSDGDITHFYRQNTDDAWFTRDDRPLTLPKGMMLEGIPVGNLKDVPGSHLVIALAGAYQDAREMDYNLIGKLPDVALALKDDNTWEISLSTGSDSIEELLKDSGHAEIDVDDDPHVSD